MWIVVGLGNPGSRYETTRHNAGFMVVDCLASRWNVGGFRRRWGGICAEAHGPIGRVLLLKPQTFMNCSGEVVEPAVRFYGIEPSEIVVVHDDMDLDFGRIKLKKGGGHGGHNGLRSIFEHLGNPDFVRVRVGIGRPPPWMDGADYVLQPFTPMEAVKLPGILTRAADAVEMLLQEGLPSAMNRYNVRPKEGEEE